jgi:hypothetical protein
MMDSIFTGWIHAQPTMNVENQMASQQAFSVAEEARSRVNQMKAEIDRLMLITQALWEILKEEHGYTEEILVNRINEIDLRDGKLDGKVATQGPIGCPKCGRANRPNRATCLYCGTYLAQQPFAR